MGEDWKQQLGLLFGYALDAMAGDSDCCRVNCGPCHGLDWYRQHANIFADECVVLAYPAGDAVWQNPDGTVNWVWLGGQWAEHKGCAHRPETGWSCDPNG